MANKKNKELLEAVSELIVSSRKKIEHLEQLYLYAVIAEHYPEVLSGAKFYVTTQKHYLKNKLYNFQGKFKLKGIGRWAKDTNHIIIAKVKDSGNYSMTDYKLVEQKIDLDYFNKHPEKVISFGAENNGETQT